MFRIVQCANACARSNNKNVRLSVATAILNTSSYIYSTSSPPSVASLNLFLDVINSIMECGKYEPEPMVRSLVALGTVLFLPDGRGADAVKSLKGRGISSMLERLANTDDGTSDGKTKAVVKEILSIL